MDFQLPKYQEPDFQDGLFLNSPNAMLEAAPKDGVAPEHYHATSIYPEYFKIKDKWVLATESRMDCVVVVNNDGSLDVKEFRNIRRGDMVVVGRNDKGGDGIYVHANGFLDPKNAEQDFAFRSGRSRETAYSKDYDDLAKLLSYEREQGYVVWVLGPAVVFDHHSREAMTGLISKGYVDVLFGGNAVATHDLEGAISRTALGQDIYHQDSKEQGHYHHIDVINRARYAGSLFQLIEQENIQDGIVHACAKNDVPLVLAGSIRDDGPLPGVIANVYEAQETMRNHTRKATTIVALATQLHTIATGNITPSYQQINGTIRPVFIYTIDISEFAVNKLRDRGSLEVRSIVTNVQDFLVKLNSRLND